MIEYALVLDDGTLFSLNGATVTFPLSDSLTFGENGSSFSNTIIEKSYGPGSIKLGDSRLEAQKLVMSFSSVFQTETDYDTFINEFLSALSRAEYIRDVTNEKQTKVAVSECSESYEKGSYKRSMDFSASFIQLTPYWEALVDTVINITTAADVPYIQNLNNAGSMPAQPVITMIAAAACAGVSFSVVGENTGVYIEDDLFGTTGYLTMILDNEAGTLEIGSLNRKASILDGTGFFEIKSGVVTLSILSTVALDIEIAYKQRNFR